MSRAIVSLFKLDWKAYISYNIMAVPMVASILAAFHFKQKWVVSIAVVVASANMIYYIVRMVQGTIL